MPRPGIEPTDDAARTRIGRPLSTALPLTVVFDLDGTLVDSVDDVSDLMNSLLATLGRRPLTRIDAIACFGFGARNFVHAALERTGPLPDRASTERITGAFIEAYTTTAPHRSRLYPGAAASVQACRAAGRRVALCTNKPLAATHILLDHLAMEGWFDAICGGDSLPQRKPDAAPLLHAIALAGGEPSRAILIGDSETDAACGAAAAVPVILVEGGYHKAPLASLGARHVVPDLAATAAILREL